MMDDFEVMKRARLRWVRECAKQNLPMPTKDQLAAYHRGFLDALDVALANAMEDRPSPQEETP